MKFKKVSTPFPDDKIARPIMDEAEARGELPAHCITCVDESVVRSTNG